jgi:hypothetical protein
LARLIEVNNMDLAERYRTEAEHCLREAARLRDRDHRGSWEAFAERWLELAGELQTRVSQPTASRRITANRAGKPA